MKILRKKSLEENDSFISNEQQILKQELQVIKSQQKKRKRQSAGVNISDLQKPIQPQKPETSISLPTHGFTNSSGTVDMDKHMHNYIQTELNKRQINSLSKSTQNPIESHSLDDFLPDVKHLTEGSINSAQSTLTTVLELDLGIDAKFNNIIACEKAKKEFLMKQNSKIPIKKPATVTISKDPDSRFLIVKDLDDPDAIYHSLVGYDKDGEGEASYISQSDGFDLNQAFKLPKKQAD